jgi:hypothetical protein
MFHPVGILYRGVINALAHLNFVEGAYTPMGYNRGGAGIYAACKGSDEVGWEWALGAALGNPSHVIQLALRKTAKVSDSETLRKKAAIAAQQLQALKPTSDVDERRISNRLVITQDLGRFAYWLGVDAYINTWDNLPMLNGGHLKEINIINRTAVIFKR